VAFIDYFPATVALDPTTDAALEGAEADVYAIEDVEFTTPLPITDVQGVAMEKLVAGPSGIFPAFRVDGYTQVVPVSGGVVSPPMTSLFGAVLALLPTPAGATAGQAVATDGMDGFALMQVLTAVGFSRIEVVLQSVYDELDPPDPDTLYVRMPG
jgi:hypothetical protein